MATQAAPSALIDPFGRTVDYIRVSVTDRCDFRCVYCMAEEMTFLPKSELLSLEELEQVCRKFMAMGTRKIRLTGGEPLVRRNIMQLIRNLGAAQGFDMTIIEVMPMGDIGNENRVDQYLPLSQVRADLSKRFTLIDSDYQTPGPARYVTVAETGKRLGFITPLTHNFCESCNRVRVTCTGQLYMCLGQDDHADLSSALRNGGDAGLEEAIVEAIGRKPKGHDFVISRRAPAASVSRHMNVTGG